MILINLCIQSETVLVTCSLQLREESIITPRSLATGTGLISLSSNLTGGRDGRLLIICGTPITRSLVLSGLTTREFVPHHLAIAERSLFEGVHGIRP